MTNEPAFEVVTGPIWDPNHWPVTDARAIELITNGAATLDEFEPLVEEIDGMDPMDWLSAMTDYQTKHHP